MASERRSTSPCPTLTPGVRGTAQGGFYRLTRVCQSTTIYLFYYSSVHFAFERCQSNSKLSPTTGRGNNYSRGTDSPTMVLDSKFQGMGNACGHQGLPLWPPHKSPLLSSLSGGIAAIRCSHRAMLDACSSGKIFGVFASSVWFIQGKKKFT